MLYLMTQILLERSESLDVVYLKNTVFNDSYFLWIWIMKIYLDLIFNFKIIIP